MLKDVTSIDDDNLRAFRIKIAFLSLFKTVILWHWNLQQTFCLSHILSAPWIENIPVHLYLPAPFSQPTVQDPALEPRNWCQKSLQRHYIKTSATRLFVQRLFQANNKENTKSSHYQPFVRAILRWPESLVDLKHWGTVIYVSVIVPLSLIIANEFQYFQNKVKYDYRSLAGQ